MRHAVLIEAPSELTSAGEIQRRFMPQSRPRIDGVDYSARCRQMHAIGGDFYDFVPFANGRLAITIGDASGKGVSAALMMSNVLSSLRTAAFFVGHNPAAAIAAVNRQVYDSSPADRYATLFYGAFDSATRTLRYVNAGHCPPMLIRRDNSILWLDQGGAPVGMFPDWKYEEGFIELHPGDFVVAYTDGVVEATDPDGEEWGVENLRQIVAGARRRTADDMVDAIFDVMDQFALGVQADDATALVLNVPV